LARETRVRNKILWEERDVTLSVIRDPDYMAQKLFSHAEQMKEEKLLRGYLKGKGRKRSK
jgi:hypothetical protein